MDRIPTAAATIKILEKGAGSRVSRVLEWVQYLSIERSCETALNWMSPLVETVESAIRFLCEIDTGWQDAIAERSISWFLF